MHRDNFKFAVMTCTGTTSNLPLWHAQGQLQICLYGMQRDNFNLPLWHAQGQLRFAFMACTGTTSNLPLWHAQGQLQIYPHIFVILNDVTQTNKTACSAQTFHQFSPQELLHIAFLQPEAF
jgi:hypothetical protein